MVQTLEKLVNNISCLEFRKALHLRKFVEEVTAFGHLSHDIEVLLILDHLNDFDQILMRIVLQDGEVGQILLNVNIELQDGRLAYYFHMIFHFGMSVLAEFYNTHDVLVYLVTYRIICQNLLLSNWFLESLGAFRIWQGAFLPDNLW